MLHVACVSFCVNFKHANTHCHQAIAAEVHVDKMSSLKFSVGKYTCVCLSISGKYKTDFGRNTMGTFAHAETDYFWTCSFACLSISGGDVFAKCHNLKQSMLHFATFQKCRNKFLEQPMLHFATFQKCRNIFFGEATIAI